MDIKEKAIVERFFTKFSAMYTLTIAKIVGVSQKDVIQVQQELRDRSRRAYIGGMVLEWGNIPDDI